jgi:hypothetical protein
VKMIPLAVSSDSVQTGFGSHPPGCAIFETVPVPSIETSAVTAGSAFNAYGERPETVPSQHSTPPEAFVTGSGVSSPRRFER